jgi:hypothetical protein
MTRLTRLCSASDSKNRVAKKAACPEVRPQITLRRVLKMRLERGCVGDQPQHAVYCNAVRVVHALRLTLRASPHSETNFDDTT